MPVTEEALNHFNDVALHAATQKTTWYLGLISSVDYSALAVGDTLASHAGWTELTAYTGDRKEWTEGASAAGVITNAVGVDFTMNDTFTAKGAFLCSVASGTDGVLLATWLFDGGDESGVSGNILRIFATNTLDQAA